MNSRPYKTIGEKIGLTEEKVLAKIRDWQHQKVIRRLGALVDHYQLGIRANAMVAWQVPGYRVKEVAEVMISFPEVSHCYERGTTPSWPYNLFTMIHGRKEEDCRQVAEAISKKTGITKYELLFSRKEFKKESMKYFEKL